MRAALLKARDHGGTCPGGWILGGYGLGLERSVIQVEGKKYLGRWILYVAGRSFRLHKFYCGDDARAPHSHPWKFWTFPLCKGYWEWVAQYSMDPLGSRMLWKHWVPGWRLNFRPASYQHIVAHPEKPFWTIVVTGKRKETWGFWPSVDGEIQFVPWWEWK